MASVSQVVMPSTPLLRPLVIAAVFALAAGCSQQPAPRSAASPTPVTTAPTAAPATPAPGPPAAPPPSAAPGTGSAPGRCAATSLTLGVKGLGAAAGNLYQVLSLTNVSGQPCWLYGFPGISPTPARVVLTPGAAAPFYLHYGDVPDGGERTCPQSQTILVTPPDETRQVRAADQMTPCQGGTIDVSPVLAPGTHGDMGS